MNENQEEQKVISLLNVYVMTYEQAQQLRMETMNRMRNWLRDTVPKEEWDEKDFSDKKILAGGIIPNNLMDLLEDRIIPMEKNFNKLIKREIKNYPLWDWLKDVRGISHILGARLLHRIDGKEFAQVSNLWSYAGLDGPGWRGRPHNWDLTSICYLIGDSFVKAGGEYRKVYDDRKEYERTKPPCEKCLEKDNEDRCSDGHIHNRAKRYAVKEFLKDLWVEMDRLKEE